jgi:plastocyanin
MKNIFDALTVSRRILIVSLFLIVLLVSGFGISCQSQEPEPAPLAPSPELPEEPSLGESPATLLQIEVAIEGFAFKPAILNIPVGSTVVWFNNDSVIHTVTARNNSFDSGSLAGGDTFSHTFKEKGIFEYYCIPHPYMTGKVTIE